MVKWTDEMSRYVLLHYKDETYEDMGRKLGVTASCVANHCHALGVNRDRFCYRVAWTDEKLDYLRENYGKMPACDIADHIRISAPVVRKKAGELGLVDAGARSWGKLCHGRYVSGYKNRSNIPYEEYMRREVA